MTEGTIALAADHAGFELKEAIKADLVGAGRDVLDLGTMSAERVDYPDFAERLAEAVKTGRAGRGILICGSGIGIGIAANRHREIRAAVCHDVTTAQLARRHNDANVIALGARIVGPQVARDCVAAFLETPFDGGRHADRVAKLG